jgi:hypothetical protein
MGFGVVLIGAPYNPQSLKGNKSKKREENPMPRMLCSKVREKSNTEHPGAGPKLLSPRRTQAVVIINKAAQLYQEK